MARAADASAPAAAVMAARGTERRPFALSIATAALSAWILFIALYAVIFALSGVPIGRAVRGALANGIPDGLLVLAVFRRARRAGVPRTAREMVLTSLSRGLLFVALAAGAKVLLLWIDVALTRGGEPFRLFAGVIAWQIFVSALLYVASSSAAHVWAIDRRLREEEARAARAEALRARVQLSALRAQLNPHFLFNVLHSAVGMVRRDPALAESALESLGDLLRYALRVHRDGMDQTLLRDEWEFMETYLRLEKIRLGDRLEAALRAEEGALDWAVPTFSLQPLVENAVRHGIAPRAAGGRVSVEARIEGGALRLEVRNDAGRDGPPAAGGPEPEGEGGMGLRILQDRLDALYRGKARMTAGPAGAGGYRVVLLLPAESSLPEGEA
jgi:anti-sigma regulatory factor (Ser/Thr protein kinase)/predicted nucleic acid-binding protein